MGKQRTKVILLESKIKGETIGSDDEGFNAKTDNAVRQRVQLKPASRTEVTLKPADETRPARVVTMTPDVDLRPATPPKDVDLRPATPPKEKEKHGGETRRKEERDTSKSQVI